MAESEKKLMETFQLWTSVVEDSLRVNMDKRKILVCCAKPVQSGKPLASGRGVCGKGVGRNSILCTQCGKWIHK